MSIESLAAERPDFAAIAAWIPKGASVLDLGCGDGSLLRYLKETRSVRGYGVEISDMDIVSCIANGVNVIQNDLDSGLSDFEDNTFDFVILSQTLQATRHTEALIQEMLRVGREGIVSFPNFGYWKSRLNVMLGNMPVSRELPYQWYDTPNVHLCTLNDFESFCRKYCVSISARSVMTGGVEVGLLPNLLGSTAVYRFQRGV
ncbi:methionine biosynthesis protein MetW [Gallionella capsiferriformans]|jgi:methionine biosynthesis protein MetW|uniref:Methionine biosynthesis protein MetW n=1 Tax=Gallionella capsiferriformans (strain ES-2) TaxID=395494 RepID=D9SIB3_GALCS|nr:methionine biosynthesis protein MetW [Gallionella capsiferriformans]ADL54170.1 methionine biosynthesis protein MetW [Gallionella capsiferriformans ES-2]